jgi:hypothetical protein
MSALRLNWLFSQRRILKDVEPEEYSQEELRDIQRMRDEIQRNHEKVVAMTLAHRVFRQ